MRRLSIEEVKELQMSILDSIHDFCKQNGLRYSLSYGTLLGAVRHKGYIPWDDDIDIMMPRPDYDAFISRYPQSAPSNLFLDDRTTNKDYVSTFAKIIDKRTYSTGPNIIDDRGVFVDIFCIDGGPEEMDAATQERITTICNNLRRAGKYYKYTSNKAKKAEYFLKWLIKRLNTPSLKKSYANLDEIVGRYSFESSEYAGDWTCDVGYSRTCLKKECYLRYRDIPFEDRIYRCIVDYDLFLTKQYGHYMAPPPLNMQVPTHFSEAYIKERSPIKE